MEKSFEGNRNSNIIAEIIILPSTGKAHSLSSDPKLPVLIHKVKRTDLLTLLLSSCIRFLRRLRLDFHDENPSFAPVYSWFNEFKRGRTSFTDDLREVCSFMAKTKNNISAVRHMIKTNKRITYQQIRVSLGIDISQVHKIPHEYLAVRKLCSRWVLHSLTEAQSFRRVNRHREMPQRSAGGDSKSVYDNGVLILMTNAIIAEKSRRAEISTTREIVRAVVAVEHFTTKHCARSSPPTSVALLDFYL
ncbi:Putative uncharacterized protein FLJ37770 [Eumeta japonica]|uniref:Mos1 transposase HTH domain-containing protein n=1 Tax=Eumeta variegata TaxID=151549 RepID=A0A4C1VK56_EUMVA|nr:Putative uncharacterized protein FLJ37770 [Eumeta japonica]